MTDIGGMTGTGREWWVVFVIPVNGGISWQGLGGCAGEIPAFAGMTDMGAGMTEKEAGMTDMGAGMTEQKG